MNALHGLTFCISLPKLHVQL